jgi:hypothetical protein
MIGYAFSSREPVSTRDQVRGRLSLENALAMEGSSSGLAQGEVRAAECHGGAEAQRCETREHAR